MKDPELPLYSWCWIQTVFLWYLDNHTYQHINFFLRSVPRVRTRTAHRARRSRRKSKTTYPPDLHHPGHPSPSDTATVFPETTPPCEHKRFKFFFQSKKINPNLYQIDVTCMNIFDVLQFFSSSTEQVSNPFSVGTHPDNPIQKSASFSYFAADTNSKCGGSYQPLPPGLATDSFLFIFCSNEITIYPWSARFGLVQWRNL